MKIKERIKKSLLYFYLLKLIKKKEVLKRKHQLLQEALVKFEEECPVHGSISDYKRALRKHFVTYSEYMHQYEFWRLTEQERNQFISRNALSLRVYYEIPWEIKRIFWNKVEFLNHFSEYIHRDWLCAKNVSFEIFYSFALRVGEGIIKPLNNCCGAGISKVKFPSNILDLKEIYYYCVSNDMLVEECIKGCEELQEFHPKSLNTIRVVTVNNRVKPIVFGAFFRMGKGDSVIDNAHAGGIFAQINIVSGLIESEGIDAAGNHYKKHPDSCKEIEGFQIPCWNEIKSVCIAAASVVPQNPITGWDVIINGDGQIEFVEGNHGPDFDVMQSPLKIGVKDKLFNLLNTRKL